MGNVTIQPNQRVVRISEHEILSNTAFYKNHREYVAAKFKEIGFEVTRWTSVYEGERTKHQGLQYYKADSDIYLLVEVVGTIGVNIRPIEAIDAKGN